MGPSNSSESGFFQNPCILLFHSKIVFANLSNAHFLSKVLMHDRLSKWLASIINDSNSEWSINSSNSFSQTFFVTLTANTSVSIFPISVTRRQIMPGCSPKHGIKKLPVVASTVAQSFLTPRQQKFDFCLRIIRYIMSFVYIRYVCNLSFLTFA